MRPIKSIPQKESLLPLILAAIMIFLAVHVYLYFRTDNNAVLGQYDVLSFCESIPTPVFSVPEGIYDQPFELEIQAPDGFTIYYTTDGSIPTVHSNRYKRPITVDPQKNPNKKILTIPTSFRWKAPYGEQNHCVVFRARCFRDGEGYGKVENVIFSTPNIKQHQGFQIVHILIEADSLFSPKRGIYVLGEKYYSKKALVDIQNPNSFDWRLFPANFLERGRQWTRPATFILMNLSGETLFEQNVNLCLNGRLTRVYPEKSLRIIPDSKNDTVIRYPFFDELPYSSYKRLVLRNSGNDVESTMFRDAMVHRLAYGTRIDIQAYTPSVVYINGNYWGIHNIREKMDELYLAGKYGSSLQNIAIIELFMTTTKNYVPESTLNSFHQFLKYIRQNSLANHDAYNEACSQIDVDNFIDYMIIETFFANQDWPNNNIRLYRFDYQTELMKQNGIDAGKWRNLFFDLDWSMGYMGAIPSINMFEKFRTDFADDFIPQIFWGLMDNTDFKDEFITRYEYLIENHLTSEKMLEQVNIFEQIYQHEIVRHIARWRLPWNMQYWRQQIEIMRNFAKERPDIVLEQLKTL